MRDWNARSAWWTAAAATPTDRFPQVLEPRFEEAIALDSDGALVPRMLETLLYLAPVGSRAYFARRLVEHRDDLRAAPAAVLLGDKALYRLDLDEALMWYTLAEAIDSDGGDGWVSEAARDRATWVLALREEAASL